MWNMRNFTVRENLHEMKYWVNRWFALKGRSILFSIMPNWLVREAMLRASRHIAGEEKVAEVPFMTIFERVCKGGVVDGSNASR